jgi:hypothetical protein
VPVYGSQIESRRDAVPVNHTTQSIASLDLTAAPFRHRWRCRFRRRQTQRPIWTMSVVVINEDAKGLVEMRAIEDQQPIETLRADGPHQSLGHPVRLRRAKRCANDLDPSLRNILRAPIDSSVAGGAAP